MENGIDWKLVKHVRGGKIIGAIGYVEDKIATVATFYPDKDWNHDGRVDLTERFVMLFSLKGKALTEVLTQAQNNPDLFMRDPSGLRQMHSKAFLQFASGMTTEAIYITYFKMSVGLSCGALAAQLAKGQFARFFVKKGMEQAVKRVYEKVTAPVY